MSPATLSLRVVTPVDPYDMFEPIEIFLDRGLLRQAEDLADANGTNVGDWLADLLLAAVEGRVSA